MIAVVVVAVLLAPIVGQHLDIELGGGWWYRADD